MSTVLSSKRNKRRKQKRGSGAKAGLSNSSKNLGNSAVRREVGQGCDAEPVRNIGMMVADLLSGKEKCLLCQKECTKLAKSEWETGKEKKPTWFICEKCQEDEKDNPLLQSVLDSREIACNEKLLEALDKPEMCKCEACLGRLTMNENETEETSVRTKSWAWVREVVPKVYNNDVDFEKLDKEELSEHLSRLIEYDPHLFFQRMECDVREYINEQKCHVLKLLTRGYKDSNAAMKLADLMLKIYSDIVRSAEVLSELMPKLDNDHLSKFGTSWVKLNKCLFQNMVYAEPMIHRVLPELLKQLRKATERDTEQDATFTNILHKYLRFGDEMFQLQVDWRETEKLIDEYTDHYVATKNTLKLSHHSFVNSFSDPTHANSLPPPPPLSVAGGQVEREASHWDLFNAVQNGAMLPKFLPLLAMPGGIPQSPAAPFGSSSVDPQLVPNFFSAVSMTIPTYSLSSTTSTASTTVFTLTTTSTAASPVVSYISNKYFSEIHPPSVPSDDSVLSSSDEEGTPRIIEHPSLVLPPELEGPDPFSEMLHMNGLDDTCSNDSSFSMFARDDSPYIQHHSQDTDSRKLGAYPFVRGSQANVAGNQHLGINAACSTSLSFSSTPVTFSATEAVPSLECMSSPAPPTTPPIGLWPPPSALQLGHAFDIADGVLSHRDPLSHHTQGKRGLSLIPNIKDQQNTINHGDVVSVVTQLPQDGMEAPTPTPLDSAAEDESSSESEGCGCFPQKCIHVKQLNGAPHNKMVRGESSSNNEDGSGSVSDSDNDDEGDEYEDADDEGEEDEEGECNCEQCLSASNQNLQMKPKIEDITDREPLNGIRPEYLATSGTSFVPLDSMITPTSSSSNVGVCECASCQQYASATSLCMQNNPLDIAGGMSSAATNLTTSNGIGGAQSVALHLPQPHSFSAMQPLSLVHRHLYSPMIQQTGLIPSQQNFMAPQGTPSVTPTSVHSGSSVSLSSTSPFVISGLNNSIIANSIYAAATSGNNNGSETTSFCNGLPLYQPDWAQAVVASGGNPKISGLMPTVVNPTTGAWLGQYGFPHQIAASGVAVSSPEALFSSSTNALECGLVQQVVPATQAEHDGARSHGESVAAGHRNASDTNSIMDTSTSIVMQAVNTAHFTHPLLGLPPSTAPFAVTGSKLLNGLGSSAYETPVTSLSSVYQLPQVSSTNFSSTVSIVPTSSFQFPTLGTSGILHQPQFFHPGTTVTHKDGQFTLGGCTSGINPGLDGILNTNDLQQSFSTQHKYNPFLPAMVPPHLPPPDSVNSVQTSQHHIISEDSLLAVNNISEGAMRGIPLQHASSGPSIIFPSVHQAPTTSAVADGKTSAAVAATTASVQQQIRNRKKLVAHGKLGRQQGQKKMLNAMQQTNATSQLLHDQSVGSNQNCTDESEDQKLPFPQQQKFVQQEKAKPQLHMHLKFQFQPDQSSANQPPAPTSTIVYERPGELRAVFQHPAPPQGGPTQVHNHTPQGSGPNVIVEYGNQKHILPLPSAISGYPPTENPEPGTWPTEPPNTNSNPPPPPPLPPPPVPSTTKPVSSSVASQTPVATQTTPHKHPSCTGPTSCTQNDGCNSTAGNNGQNGNSSTGPNSSKYCDCCYCEFFGNGGPPPAPTSKNYPEMRERLRLKLNKKMQAEGKDVSNNSDSSDYVQRDNKLATKQQVLEQRDERSLEEILSFIEGAGMKDNETDRSKKAVKKARQKLRKEEERKRKEREEAEMKKQTEKEREGKLREQAKKAKDKLQAMLEEADKDQNKKGKKKRRKQFANGKANADAGELSKDNDDIPKDFVRMIASDNAKDKTRLTVEKPLKEMAKGDSKVRAKANSTENNTRDKKNGKGSQAMVHQSKHKEEKSINNSATPNALKVTSREHLKKNSQQLGRKSVNHGEPLRQLAGNSDNSSSNKTPGMTQAVNQLSRVIQEKSLPAQTERTLANKQRLPSQRIQKQPNGVQKNIKQSNLHEPASAKGSKLKEVLANHTHSVENKFKLLKTSKDLQKISTLEMTNGVGDHYASKRESENPGAGGGRSLHHHVPDSSSGSSTPEKNTEILDYKASSNRKQRRKKNAPFSSHGGGHVDQVFMPKGDDNESSEMDDIEKEIDSFKRFCLDSSSILREKKKISVNWKDFSFKKNHTSH